MPYQLVKRQLDARLTGETVEVFHKGQRVANHVRSRVRSGYTTVAAHMPEAHRQYSEWTPARLIHWAEQTGPATAQLITAILTARTHPQQGYRPCLGIMRLGKTYGEARLEAACHRALRLGSHRYKSIESILKHDLDQQPLHTTQQELNLPDDHDNIRGPAYYH